MVRKLLGILEVFDHQERTSAQDRGDQESNRLVSLAQLVRVNRHNHRPRAHKQNRSVRGTHLDVQVLVRLPEVQLVHPAAKREREEQRAEEHDLRDQERPHTNDVALALLLVIFKLMMKINVVVAVVSVRKN